MSAQIEGTAKGFLTINDRDRNGSLVARCRSSAFQDLGSHALVSAIHDHGFETLARQLTDSRVGVHAMLNSDFQIAEHATQKPDYLVIRAED
jgi:hypothetical protein